MVSLGFAPFIRQVSMSILVIVVNNSLRAYGGDIAIAVFSVANRVVMFATMPLIGIVAGVQPVVGFNYGENNMGRVKESLKTSVLSTVAIGTVFFILFMAIPSKIMNLFSIDAELINNGVFPLRTIMILFPFIGFQLIGAGFFQYIGKARPAIVLSLTRQVLFFNTPDTAAPPAAGNKWDMDSIYHSGSYGSNSDRLPGIIYMIRGLLQDLKHSL